MTSTKELVKKLIKIKSVTKDKEEVNKCSDFVLNYLQKNNLYVKQENYKGYKIVYAANHNTKKNQILLNSHIDVVSAKKEQFVPIEKGKRIIGRGALDCKGHAALVMNLLCKLKNCKHKIGAIFSSDEETGGYTTKHMIQKGYSGKFTIVLDGNFDRVIIAQKGIIGIKLSARGKPCHSSAPWRGENALEKLINGYLKIKPLFKKVTEENSWNKTCAPTIIHGGEAENKVPGMAYMILNIRFTEKTNPDDLFKKIKKVSDLKCEKTLFSPYMYVPEKNKLIQEFYKSLKSTMNKNMQIGKMNGATDARHFQKTGYPIAITGLKGKGAHSDNEYLYTPSILKMEKALYNFICNEFNN